MEKRRVCLTVSSPGYRFFPRHDCKFCGIGPVLGATCEKSDESADASVLAGSFSGSDYLEP